MKREKRGVLEGRTGEEERRRGGEDERMRGEDDMAQVNWSWVGGTEEKSFKSF